MTKPVPDWMFKRLLRSRVQLVKITKDIIPPSSLNPSQYEEYGQTTTTGTTFTIKAEIQPITSQDIIDIPPGMLEIGDAIGFFQKEYLLEGSVYTIKSEDLIIAGGTTYEVQTITNFYQGDRIIYRRAYLKNKG